MLQQRPRTPDKPRINTRKQGKRGNGEGSVYRIGDRWQASLTLPDGHRAKRNAPTRREAAEKLAELQAERARGDTSAGSAETVATFLTWWIGVLEAKVGTGPDDLSVNTFHSYSWAIGIIRADHGGRRLRDLTPEHVESTLARLAAEGRARASVARVRSVTARALSVAQARGKVSRNVAELAEMPRTKAPTERRSLTVAEAARLLSALDDDDPGPKGTRSAYVASVVRSALTTGLCLGLRPGELFGLRWSDVDLERGTLKITGSLKREGSDLRLGDVKRGIRSSRRVLALPAPAIDALRTHRKVQAEHAIAALPGEWDGSLDLVHTAENGSPIHSSNFNRQIARVLDRAGLGHHSLNELTRHSAASVLAAKGVPLAEIASMLGHSSTRMLERHYRHELRPSLSAHVAVINDAFGTVAGREAR